MAYCWQGLSPLDVTLDVLRVTEISLKLTPNMEGVIESLNFFKIAERVPHLLELMACVGTHGTILSNPILQDDEGRPLYLMLRASGVVAALSYLASKEASDIILQILHGLAYIRNVNYFLLIKDRITHIPVERLIEMSSVILESL